MAGPGDWDPVMGGRCSNWYLRWFLASVIPANAHLTVFSCRGSQLEISKADSGDTVVVSNPDGS